MVSSQMFHEEFARQRTAELRHEARLARLANDVKRDGDGIVLATPRRLRALLRNRAAAQVLRPVN